jgi:hypothetical protein
LTLQSSISEYSPISQSPVVNDSQIANQRIANVEGFLARCVFHS